MPPRPPSGVRPEQRRQPPMGEPPRGGRPQRGPRRPERRRASHSAESVLSETVALLDESGEQALTFRALAARLGGGVASIYWYVASRDELLDRAADHVLGEVLESVTGIANAGSEDALADLRSIAVTLFDAIVDRPWLGAYFMRDTDVQPNALHLYELMGQQVLRLPLTSRQAFHAVSAVVGFVVGTAADMGQQAPEELVRGEVGRDEYLHRYAERWRALPPAEFPFLHHIIDEFDGHDDADQFRAGLDLLLAGLRLQAEG